MSSPREIVRAIARAATAWSDPEHPRRDEAVVETLGAENSFTEEAVAFAVNQQMTLLSEEAIETWVRGRSAARRRTVGVLNAGNIPLAGLQDLLAVVLTGHDYVGTLSSKSPFLLPAFLKDVAEHSPALDARFASATELFSGAGMLIAAGSDETLRWVRERCDDSGIPPGRRLLRGHTYAAAVLDGREGDDDYERLAEDVLLHEGMGCRSVAVVWAPSDLSPDGLLDAMARFRAVFPAHPDTPGRLKMQRAFLEAVDAPHAYGDGLEFLVSRGEPDEQQPGHLRWSEYDDLGAVIEWLETRRRRIQLVVVGEHISGRLRGVAPICAFGEAQRPTLGWRPDGIDTVDFLTAEGST